MAGALDTVVSNVLGRSVVEVRSRLAPPFEVALYQRDGSPSEWAQWARPSFTVKVDGNVVSHVAPAGEPEDIAWVMAVAVGAAVSLLVLALLVR